VNIPVSGQPSSPFSSALKDTHREIDEKLNKDTLVDARMK
jgi:hypothetical protein